MGPSVPAGSLWRGFVKFFIRGRGCLAVQGGVRDI